MQTRHNNLVSIDWVSWLRGVVIKQLSIDYRHNEKDALLYNGINYLGEKQQGAENIFRMIIEEMICWFQYNYWSAFRSGD